MEPLHDDDAVLAAAFAFIDELHDTDESSTSGRSDGMARAARWKQQRRSEVDGLKTAAQELERFLTQRQETDEAAASPWASVAERQRLQRGDVVVENALLKEAVRERAAEARRLLKLCQKRFKDQSLLRYAQWTPMPCRVPVLNDAVLTAALQQSLDMIFLEAQHAPRTPQPTSLTTTVQSFGSKRSTCGDGIDIDVVDSGYFPFQLHLVDRVQWDCVLRDDAHVGDARRFCIVQPDGIYRNYTYYVQSKIGGVAVQGVTGIRRIYEPDGSVLVLWSSQSFPVGTDNSPDTKILDRFQLTETGWIRFSRAAHSTLNQTVVFADVKHRVKIRARRPQDAKRESLRDAKESMVQVMTQHGGKQRQLLENRLLDASMMSGQ